MATYSDRDLDTNPRRGMSSGLIAGIVLAVLIVMGLIFWGSSNRTSQTINPGPTTSERITSPGNSSANPTPPASAPSAPSTPAPASPTPPPAGR